MAASPTPFVGRMVRKEPFFTAFSAACGVAVAVALLWVVYHLLKATSAVIGPFVVGVALALLLNPLVNMLTRRATAGRRLPAVIYVFLLFLVIFAALITFVVPVLIGQISELARRFPEYFDSLTVSTNHWLETHHQIAGIPLPANTNALVQQYSAQFSDQLRNFGTRVVTVLASSFGVLFSLILIPIITFYVLNDMPRMRSRLNFIIPERYRESVRLNVQLVGGVFGDYLRNLGIVCTLYGAANIVSLLIVSIWFAKLRVYSLLIGIAAGILYAIPYIGTFATLALSVVIPLAIGVNGTGTFIVFIVVLALNPIFDNIITPRLVGGSVGLHPIISMFALVLGGELLGFWGLVLSVPIAASIQLILFRIFPRLNLPTPLLPLIPAEERREGHETTVTTTDETSDTTERTTVTTTRMEEITVSGDTATTDSNPDALAETDEILSDR